MKELNELRAKAVEADPILGELLVALRDAAATVNGLGLVVADLQREATDCEFEEIPLGVRAHLDGSLLQRTRYVSGRAADLGTRLRDLAAGVRSLRADCALLGALVPAPADSPEPVS